MEGTDANTTAICTLTSIPVQKFVEEGKYNYDELGRVARSVTKSLNIAIEVNGVHWHSECNGQKSRQYHNHKTTELQSRGIRLIHITDTEWIISREVVESRIRFILS